MEIYNDIFWVNAFGNMTMWFYVIRQIEWPGIKDIKVLRNTKEIIQLFIPVIAGTNIYGNG